MGRRTVAMFGFIRLLRTTKPKYSFEVFVFNFIIGLACIVFIILGETRLWAVSCGVLWISCGIHWWRLRRAVKQELAWLERMLPQFEAAIAEYERRCAPERKPLDPAELALLRADIERARRREAAGSE